MMMWSLSKLLDLSLELEVAVVMERYCTIVIEDDIAFVPELTVHVWTALPHLWLLVLEDLIVVEDVEEVDGEVEKGLGSPSACQRTGYWGQCAHFCGPTA